MDGWIKKGKWVRESRIQREVGRSEKEWTDGCKDRREERQKAERTTQVLIPLSTYLCSLAGWSNQTVLRCHIQTLDQPSIHHRRFVAAARCCIRCVHALVYTLCTYI